MDYAARWPEPAAPPQHHLYSAPPSHQGHHYPSLTYHHEPQPQSQPPPPSYSSSYYPNPQPVPAYTLPSPAPAPAPAPASDPYLAYAPHGSYSLGPAPYYYERESHGYALKEAIRQYGVADPAPAVYASAPPAPSNGLLSIPPPVEPPRWMARPNNSRGPKKGLKAVQSAYCGVCKIDCNTREVLAIHKLGKKHKRNLQKLQDSITPKPQKPPAAATDSADKKAGPVPSKGKAVEGEETKRKAVAVPEEDLETKKRKVLEGGAEPDKVKVCTLCNVVVNSQVVYDSHIAGQKHIANVKQQQEQEAGHSVAEGEKKNADS